MLRPGQQTEESCISSRGKFGCPWKHPDKIWNPPSFLFSRYLGEGGGGGDLSVGIRSQVEKLTACLQLMSKLYVLGVHMDKFLFKSDL